MNIVTKIINNIIFKLNRRTFHKVHSAWSSWLHSKIQGWFNIHRSINTICYANERGRNNLFSIYAKYYEKIHHSFFNQVETQNKRNTFQQNKGKLEKSTLQETEEMLLYRKHQKNQSISTKVRNKASKANLLSPFFFNVMFENLSRDIKIRN